LRPIERLSAQDRQGCSALLSPKWPLRGIHGLFPSTRNIPGGAEEEDNRPRFLHDSFGESLAHNRDVLQLFELYTDSKYDPSVDGSQGATLSKARRSFGSHQASHPAGPTAFG